MKKLFTLLLILLGGMTMFAKEGGSLTSSDNPIDPSATVTLTYDGTGTNFALWEPQCFIHTWLVPYDGKSFSKDYSTMWATCNGDADYAALPPKVKMTLLSTGKYSISMNIKEFFSVAEEDLEKISDIGVVVRAQYEGDNNQTKDFTLPVQVPGVTPPEKPNFYITGDENLVGKDKAWDPKAIPVYGETYSIPNVEPGYYEMKITIDGTYETAKGYKDLTGSRRWLVCDVENGNIGIQVGGTCDLKVTYNGISFLIDGKIGRQMNRIGQSSWYVAGNFTGNASTDWSAGKIPLTYQSGKGLVGTVHLEANKEYQFKLVRVGTWPDSGIDGSVTAWYTTGSTQLMTFDNNIDWGVTFYDSSIEDEPVHIQSTFEGDYTFVVRPDDEGRNACYDVIYPEDPREMRTIEYVPGESKIGEPKFFVKATADNLFGYITEMTPVIEGGELTRYFFEIPKELTDLMIIRAPHDVPGWQYLEWGDNGNVWNWLDMYGDYGVPAGCDVLYFIRYNPNLPYLLQLQFCGPKSDGYYLIGSINSWSYLYLGDAFKFGNYNAENDQYKLDFHLESGDVIKVVKVEDYSLKTYYPEDQNQKYNVDDAHKGDKTIYFSPTFNPAWSEFGGYIYIESNPLTDIEHPALSGAASKILRDGHILILRGDHAYTITGQEVR